MTTRQPGTPGSAELSEIDVETDVLFEALAHRRRRHVLACLREYVTPMALADLADEVAILEHDATRLDGVPPEDVTSIYECLYHVHVPKLAAAGLVQYDQDRDAVAPTAVTQQVTERLDLRSLAES